MSDFQNGKIYKITCDEEPELIYYGSTCDNLDIRMSVHKAQFKRNENGRKVIGLTSFQILKYPSSQISLVENFPCNSKEELNVRECWYIENHPCVNKNKPGVFLAKGIKQYHVDYAKENSEKILAYQAEYRKKNAEKIKANRPKYAAKAKEYYTKNKDKILEQAKAKETCECGVKFVKAGKTQHLRTAKHARLMEEKALVDEMNSLMLIDAPDMMVEPVMGA